MKAPKKQVGRPASGRRAFCIRMSPPAYAALTKTAKAAGHARLGDWLERLAAARAPNVVLDPRRMSSSELTRAFAIACNHATEALAVLHEVIDYAPAPDRGGLRAFQVLRARFENVTSLAQNVGVL